VRRVAFITLVALLTAAVATAIDVAGFAKGETLDYDLTWVLLGGSMRLTIEGDGPDRLHITSSAVSDPALSKVYSVRDEIQSFVLRNTFSTVRYQKTLNENGKTKEDDTTLDLSTRNGTRARGGSNKDFHINVPPPYFDPLSIVYRLRTLDLSPGKVHTFTVYADGNVYDMTATVGDTRETITTPAGTFTCVSVEPSMKGRGGLFRDDDSRLVIWYSDNAQHLPVRIRSDLKFGSIIATLRDVHAGVAPPVINTK
jgi:hypothetical protein